MGGGMGYGGMGYGGMGYGGGGNGMGLYLGLSVAESFMREQQRQTYLQQQLRAQLQNELSQQNAKVDAMKQQGAETNTGAATEKDIEALKLRLQLMEQQKEIEALKALSVAK